MPPGIIVDKNEATEEKITIDNPESVVIGQINGGNDPTLEASSPAVWVITSSGRYKIEEEKWNTKRKRGNYYHE
ncbi:unnamed protein product [Nezara viridula]|uniref:Uncharacterized protein n=1 Tax=Nezara viridula TaxID=85310 RepID=A0A9P0EBN3_NEZVI|nr:unnamed protein product [Nezara viridula]